MSCLFVQRLRGNVTVPPFLSFSPTHQTQCKSRLLPWQSQHQLLLGPGEHKAHRAHCQQWVLPASQSAENIHDIARIFRKKDAQNSIKTYYLTEHIMVEWRKPEVTSPDCCSAQAIVTERDPMCSSKKPENEQVNSPSSPSNLPGVLNDDVNIFSGNTSDFCTIPMKYYYEDLNQFKQNDKKVERRVCAEQCDNSCLINNFLTAVLHTEALQGDQSSL